MKTNFCPICRKKIIKQGLKNYIINSAKNEAFIQFNNILDGRGTKKTFSLIVVLRNNKHLNYYRKNFKIKVGNNIN